MSAHVLERSTRRPHRRVAASLAAALAIAGPLAAAPAAVAAPPTATVTIDVVPTSVTEGDTVTVTVSASGVSDLYAYDLAFTVDTDLLTADVASVGGPDGGFTSAAATADGATVAHTRLGTSPGLVTDGTDAVTLAVLTFTAQAAGTTELALNGARLVSSTDEVIELAAVGAATVTIAALPEPTTPPTASPSPSVTPSPSVSGTPAAPPTDADPGDLASTGANPAIWAIGGALAVALIAAGVVFMVARRRQGVHE